MRLQLRLPSTTQLKVYAPRAVTDNEMEPLKVRLLATRGAARPTLMARLSYDALRDFAVAPAHVAEDALAEFLSVAADDAPAPAEMLVSILKQHVDFVHFRGFTAV